MTKVNVTVAYDVPDQDIQDLIETAGMSIGYWAESIEDRGPDDREVVVKERDDSGGRRAVRVLKYEWLAKRLVQLGTNGPALRAGEVSNRAGEITEFGDSITNSAVAYVSALVGREPQYASEYIDGELADVIVQLAFFDGEVVYG